MSLNVVTADVAIVGGGIVGLAAAHQWSALHPQSRIVLIEKESQVCQHQSGRNSGVIHSGIYYQPGSLKATNCRQGKLALEEYCVAHNIPWDRCGKVIVATSHDEIPAMERILERGRLNGVACRPIDRYELGQLEPHASGVAGIHVPETGIVDYPAMCRSMAKGLSDLGNELLLGSPVREIRTFRDRVEVQTESHKVCAHYLVNCAGLFSDRVMKLAGLEPPAKIVPFRGEYFELSSEAQALCRNLIYPVPDPNFPFLGVHFTRMIQGGVECGPNAVLALAREGYDWKTIRIGDLTESLTYGGFLKLALKYWQTGAGEVWRSLSKDAFVKALQRLVPAIQGRHLKSAPSGVRAQAVAPDGRLVDDFLIVSRERMVHVCNAPSPAATACLAIGQSIAQELQKLR